MKHIKKFNENFYNEAINTNIDELKDLADSSLVYLLDEGFKLEYYPGVGQEIAIKFIAKDGGVKWGDIKDYFIPFLERLQNDYILQENALVQFINPSSNSMSVVIDTLIRDYSKVNPDWWARFCDLGIKNIFIKILSKR